MRFIADIATIIKQNAFCQGSAEFNYNVVLLQTVR